jgi:hypothetical protein
MAPWKDMYLVFGSCTLFSSTFPKGNFPLRSVFPNVPKGVYPIQILKYGIPLKGLLLNRVYLHRKFLLRALQGALFKYALF